MSEQNGQPQDPAPTLVVVDEAYHCAFIGHDISPGLPPRAVYSLPQLCELEMIRLRCDEEEAQKSIVAMVHKAHEQHGAAAPIFVDDSVLREPKKERSRIIRPGG